MAVTARGGMILEWSRMNRGVRNTSFSHHDNKLGKKTVNCKTCWHLTIKMQCKTAKTPDMFSWLPHNIRYTSVGLKPVLRHDQASPQPSLHHLPPRVITAAAMLDLPPMQTSPKTKCRA